MNFPDFGEINSFDNFLKERQSYINENKAHQMNELEKFRRLVGASRHGNLQRMIDTLS